MKATRFAIFIIVLALALPTCAAAARDADELRARYWELRDNLIEEPISALYTPTPDEGPGEAALLNALDYVNFIRWLAGFDTPVALDGALNYKAQQSARVQAANRNISHYPDKPDGLADDVYSTGAAASAESNLAMFNWSAPGILSESIVLYTQDDSPSNAATVGHRRWLLSPQLGRTGFGLANDESGGSYATMHILDMSAPSDYDMIMWPSEGAFPAEFLTEDTPWSISPNPDIYDLDASSPSISLTELSSGAHYDFSSLRGSSSDSQFFLISDQLIGDGPCYIFRPALGGEYLQNQVWQVRLDGMVYSDGQRAPAREYTVEIVSLGVIDPTGVEVSYYKTEMVVGESMQMFAQVIPEWADDTAVYWTSSDESIATVDQQGMITAHSAGQVNIAARAVNGRHTEITITVSTE